MAAICMARMARVASAGVPLINFLSFSFPSRGASIVREIEWEIGRSLSAWSRSSSSSSAPQFTRCSEGGSCLQRVHPESFPHPLTPAFAEQLCASIDTDGSGDVDRVEWINFITQQARRHGERPMLKLMQVLGKQLDKLWTP